eukprot:CAMPEP_0184862836 /NCGR_PEP_ID=MMETSP0580-20130426/8042_1 /TAXON_ID=1118495 /ORGANISM="Dactyliosolen fragilissimus" /LENGTH=287 /DNA_ID=CAMNT_0027360843 /DNA_START=34 /DNA_END=897 /DNA_ORIENTATION=+
MNRLMITLVGALLCCQCMIPLTFGFAPLSSFSVSSSTSSLSRRSKSSTETTCLHAFKKVFVAGGSRGVGRCVVEKLIENGSEVVALVRSDEAMTELGQIDGVLAVKGDAYDYKTVEGAMDGCDAAITTLGSQASDEIEVGKKRIDYEGNNNVIEAAGILGCTRVILVTSIGCGSSKDAAPPAMFEVLKDVLSAKQRAENILIKYYTNMNWTIIRPGGLKTEAMTGTAILTQDSANAIGSIHREDVADLVLKALNSPNTHRQIFSAVDPEISAATNVEGATYQPFVLE